MSLAPIGELRNGLHNEPSAFVFRASPFERNRVGGRQLAPAPINVASSASAFELLTRFDTGHRAASPYILILAASSLGQPMKHRANIPFRYAPILALAPFRRPHQVHGTAYLSSANQRQKIPKFSLHQGIFRISEYIWNLNGFALQQNSAAYTAASWCIYQRSSCIH